GGLSSARWQRRRGSVRQRSPLAPAVSPAAPQPAGPAPPSPGPGVVTALCGHASRGAPGGGRAVSLPPPILAGRPGLRAASGCVPAIPPGRRDSARHVDVAAGLTRPTLDPL